MTKKTGMNSNSWKLRLILFILSSCVFTTQINAPMCGNGVVEMGEECDCGTEYNCRETEPCCDSGTCEYRNTDFICRENSKLYDIGCDLPEYCNGSSSKCPDDSSMRDASECWKDGLMSYCYSGKCRTRAAQCRYYWGEESKSAANHCYEQQNIIGSKYGNCGVDGNGNYKECSAGDEYCGKLFCDNEAEKPLAIASTYYSTYTITYIGEDGEEDIVCISANISLNESKGDPGLVYDGTICGKDSMCFENKCVNLSSMETPTCPEVEGRECAGNGLCNNNLKCQCNYNNYSNPDLCFGSLTSFGHRLNMMSLYWALFIAFIQILF